MGRMKSHRRTGTALLFTSVLAAGCSTPIAGHPVAAGGSAPTTAITWGPCEAYGGDVHRGAQCGELAVPVDYAQPDKEVATLALIRFTATGGQRVTALEPTSTFAFSLDRLESQMSANPRIGFKVMRVLGKILSIRLRESNLARSGK